MATISSNTFCWATQLGQPRQRRPADSVHKTFAHTTKHTNQYTIYYCKYSYRHQQSSDDCFNDRVAAAASSKNRLLVPISPVTLGKLGCVSIFAQTDVFSWPKWALGMPGHAPIHVFATPVARPRPMATKDSQSSATSESQPCPLSEIWPFRVPRASLPGHAPIHVLEPKGRAQAHGHQRFTKQRRMTPCAT